MPDPQYHYDHAGVSAGPVPSCELVTHGVGRDTLVWTAGMSTWQAAGQIEALAPLFVVVPPPLPPRPTPPPLPPAQALATKESPTAAPVAAVHPPSLFAPAGYSLPLLGKFADDETVWTMDAGVPFGAFAGNADLQALHKWGFQWTKQYRFELLDPAGQPLLTLHVPKPPFFNPLRKGELHVLNQDNKPLGVCRCGTSLSTKRMVTVEDLHGNVLMHVNQASIGSRDFLFETPTDVIGRGRRSLAANWKQLLLVAKNDRVELIFEPHAAESLKALGIGAVVASYLFVPNLY